MTPYVLGLVCPLCGGGIKDYLDPQSIARGLPYYCYACETDVAGIPPEEYTRRKTIANLEDRICRLQGVIRDMARLSFWTAEMRERIDRALE